MKSRRRVLFYLSRIAPVFFISFLGIVLCNCTDSAFSISSLEPIVNFRLPTDRTFQVDMDSVIVEGIQAPTFKQIPEGNFRFRFKVNETEGKGLYFQVYYQNESYRFDYLNSQGKYDSLCEENFYGVWSGGNDGFLKFSSKDTVSGYFQIKGNPRDERKYFGIDMNDYQVDENDVQKEIASIRNVPQWLESVRKKAESRKMPLDRQLELDALFSLSYQRDIGECNHRWKRNPRMGRYSMMVVVCTKEDLDKMDSYNHSLDIGQQFVHQALKF